MQDKWYGDNRDLVKWGVLLSLASRYDVKHILQVLYYRPTTWPKVDIDGTMIELPSEVIRHFRNTAAASAIECSYPVEVVLEKFEHRTSYLELVLNRIRSRRQVPGIIFLDPDTGLAPQKPSLQHVLPSELPQIWGAMHPLDLLVFYQHQTNHNGTPWVETKKMQFEQALTLPLGTAKVAKAPKLAADVVFFFIQKNRRGEPAWPSDFKELDDPGRCVYTTGPIRSVSAAPARDPDVV